MTEFAYELEPLDRVVNLYRRFREEGEPVTDSWKWACLICRAFEQESFREDVQKTIDALQVAPLRGAGGGF